MPSMLAMRLFVYPPLNETARQALLAQLPADVTATFRQDLPEPEQATAFQQAEVLLGNPPLEWFTNTRNRLVKGGIESCSQVLHRIEVISLGLRGMQDTPSCRYSKVTRLALCHRRGIL